MSETPAPVLVVDDEVQIRRFLRTGFELDGFTVQEAETGAEALRAATLQPSDLVILDLGLPDMDGADVLERLRSWSTVPLIVLSVRGGESEKVRLLEVGADDYVVKPFGMAELLARAHVGDAPPAARLARRAGDELRTAVDRFRRARRVHQRAARDADAQGIPAAADSRPALRQRGHPPVPAASEVWGNEHIDDTHYLRIFVRKLRRKIEADPTQPRILLTELGVGYRLAVPEVRRCGRVRRATFPAREGNPGRRQAGAWTSPTQVRRDGEPRWARG